MRAMARAWRTLLLAIVAVLAVACSDAAAASPSSQALGDPGSDLLALVLSRGTLILPTDPAYPPASFAVAGATRPTTTHCSADELTGAQVDGYDVATGKLLAAALGVEPCFVTPPWDELLAGHWGGRFDIAFSSIGITRSRMDNLYFTQPYYATPESFFVRTDSTARAPEDLKGRRIGVCSGCFADLYLQRKLDIPGTKVVYRVDNPVIVGYAVEPSGLADVAAGQLDAFLCQDTAGQQAIAQGLKLRALSPAAYVAFLSGALDRWSTLSVKAFSDRVNEIIAAKLADGTLPQLSDKYFHHDYGSGAVGFDLTQLNQVIN